MKKLLIYQKLQCVEAGLNCTLFIDESGILYATGTIIPTRAKTVRRLLLTSKPEKMEEFPILKVKQNPKSARSILPKKRPPTKELRRSSRVINKKVKYY